MKRLVTAAIMRWRLCLMLWGLSLASCSIVEGQAPSQYDGHWWLSISDQRREGFFSGYVDCRANTRQRGAPFAARSSVVRDLVTQFYQDSVSRRDDPVEQVLSRFRDQPSEAPRAGGQLHPGPHGYFDGMYWMQTGVFGGPDGQIGLIEGHLVCYAEPPQDPGVAFSKTPEEYRRLISEWYRLIEGTDEMDEERSYEPIADVLLRFRDGALRQP